MAAFEGWGDAHRHIAIIWSLLSLIGKLLFACAFFVFAFLFEIAFIACEGAKAAWRKVKRFACGLSFVIKKGACR